jgi:two-component system uhpT operon response regulator UhpA
MNVVETIEGQPSSDAGTRHVRVAVVDDHESVRLGLKAAFLEDGYDFVIAAAGVDELIEGLAGREST